VALVCERLLRDEKYKNIINFMVILRIKLFLKTTVRNEISILKYVLGETAWSQNALTKFISVRPAARV
jgi:hypothetical protein